MTAKRWTALVTAAVGSLVLAGAASAAAQGRSGRLYDPATVTTLKGTVVAVEAVPSRGGRSGGVHLAVESEGRKVDVHLGPQWFLDQQAFKVSKGDVVEATGSLVDLSGGKALIAREISVGGKTLTLRDEQGVPAWSGGPKRP